MPRTVTDEDIGRHEGLIRHFARQLALNQDMIEDLEQEGRLEVFRALGCYEPEKGRESTYVGVCARRAMMKYVNRRARMIRTPSYLADRGVYGPPVRSLDTSEGADAPDLVPDDSTANVERAALAREELGRVIRRAHLSPRLEEVLAFDVLGGARPQGSSSALSQGRHKARRKLRQALAA